MSSILCKACGHRYHDFQGHVCEPPMTADTHARWQKNSQETWQAMQAMRNSINEHIPMPSMESDLLQGPENSIFCAAVAEAVVAALQRVRDEAWEQAAEVADEEAKRHLWDARHAGHSQQQRAKASACWSATDMVAQRIRAALQQELNKKEKHE